MSPLTEGNVSKSGHEWIERVNREGMSKHTPGRWYWDFDRDGNWSLRSDSADVGIMDQRNCPLIEDRILIESAPDLLEALEIVQNATIDIDSSGSWGSIRVTV